MTLERDGNDFIKWADLPHTIAQVVDLDRRNYFTIGEILASATSNGTRYEVIQSGTLFQIKAEGSRTQVEFDIADLLKAAMSALVEYKRETAST